MKTSEEERVKIFTTLDVYISSFLSLKGFTPKLIVQNGSGKIVFAFNTSPELLKEIENYNGGATVKASQFALTIKALKSQIFAHKEEMRNEHTNRNRRYSEI